jgi:hypothetical protein
MPKKIILFFIAFMFLSLPSVYAEKWLGVFSTDTYPIDEYQVTKTESAIPITIDLKFEVEDHEQGSVGILADAIIKKVYQMIEKETIKKGYNAILGFDYKLIHTSRPIKKKKHRMEFVLIIAHGVPVLLEKK